MANASGGWNDLKPIAGGRLRLELAGVLRSQGVQYDVSTAHRRRALAAIFRDRDTKTADGVFAQISASPYGIVEQFATRPHREADERSLRADEARTFLDGQGYTTDGWSNVGSNHLRRADHAGQTRPGDHRRIARAWIRAHDGQHVRRARPRGIAAH